MLVDVFDFVSYPSQEEDVYFYYWKPKAKLE
jgi:hypothetical protein